eukprot:496254_1
MSSLFARYSRHSQTLFNNIFSNSKRMVSSSLSHRAVCDITDIDIKHREWYIIDSTIREGLQFCNAFFDSNEKREIASRISDFGIEYIELLNPCVSEQSFEDIKAIVDMKLNSKILTHVRCNINDVDRAIATGVDGIDIVIGTSSYLRQFSHGKSIEEIKKMAKNVIQYIQSKNENIEIRFSTEDSLRSEIEDLMDIYQFVSELNISRVGIADTVGIGTPDNVYQLTSQVYEVINNSKCDIEIHLHNDTGCAIANAYMAIKAGAKYVDTCVLGIGERNGIVPLGGFLSRMYAINKEYVGRKYKLKELKNLENYICNHCDIQIPFNNYITGYAAFTHKAGIHAKAVLNNPECYECLDPTDFGLKRYIHIAHELTGWNAIKDRCEQLNLGLSDNQVKELTEYIKQFASVKKCNLSDVDNILINHKQYLTKQLK